MNLFKKALVLTDLHLGAKSNSKLHNEDCLEFITWACELGRQQGCDTVLSLGDWHNNRASINLLTLDYSIRAIELLSSSFDQVFFLPGNHDLFYRDRRNVQSTAWARHLPNVTIIDDFFQQADVSISPWLIGDDYQKIASMESRYMFGHFELPNFMMNARVAMPDQGEIQENHFENFERVFSGHFHHRQFRRNITYIGNCFPHNYSDAGDQSRGVMILPWAAEPVFHSWPEQPLYQVLDLSQLLAAPVEFLRPRMHVRVKLDMDLSYEEANFLKESLSADYQLRELVLLPVKSAQAESGVKNPEQKFATVDEIVSQELTNIVSDHYDNNILLEIYKNL
jgi:DNA repair exonuclease SbcCD nuclease subunit